VLSRGEPRDAAANLYIRIEFCNVNNGTFVYAKHSNVVDVDASGVKSGTKYLELHLEVIQGHTFWDR